MKGDFATYGLRLISFDPSVAAWAAEARRLANDVLKTPGDMRHGKTWRVGVDELPNAQDGSVNGVPLAGGWEKDVQMPATWHQAQLSVVYPGYPIQDQGESDANHRYRVNRDAAHVDGLLPEGPEKRRHLREPHAFILGLPLNYCPASPLVVWPGSHAIMTKAFARAFRATPADTWGDIDVTDTYVAARREVFETCQRVELPARPGEATLLHRHLLHGVAPWGNMETEKGSRIIAYFRPQLKDVAEWL